MTVFADIDDARAPVVGVEDDYPAGYVDPPHSHARDQLLYATSGVMSVTTDRASFVIPPLRALWLPRGTRHEVHCRGPVTLRTLYFAGGKQAACRVIEVTDLCRALIVEIARLGTDYAYEGRNRLLVEMLAVELDSLPVTALQVPMPRDYRLLRVCRALLADPAMRRDVDAFAAMAGMARRTFTRSFRQETGMSLAIWRQQVRLLQALSLLAQGRAITTVAYDVGYDSPSAFTAMFHRAFGVPPSQYQPR